MLFPPRAGPPRHPRRHVSPHLPLSVIVAALALGAGVPARAAPYNPLRLPPGQVADVRRICRRVMGLSPGEEHFQTCVDSLMTQVQALDRARASASARSDCLAAGAPAGGPALAECEVRRSEDAVAASAPIDAEGPAAKSYFYASTGEVMRRERMACARLGLEPAAPGFNSCVQGLQSAMFAADHPQN